MKNIVLRSASGLVYVVLIVGSLIVADLFPLGFWLLMAFFALAGFHEALNLFDGESRRSFSFRLLDYVGALSLYGLITMIAPMVQDVLSPECMLASLVFPLYLLIRVIAQLFRPTERAISDLAHTFLALVYVVMPLGLLVLMGQSLGYLLMLSGFVMIWLNDTGAYLTGSMIGKHKFFERISPKKTWEGTIGGVVFAMLGAAMCYLCNDYFEIELDLIEWLIIGFVVAVAATIGDLLESAFKRNAGVKDSGNLIPGHGGILDRIDSLLFVVPTLILLFSILAIFS